MEFKIIYHIMIIKNQKKMYWMKSRSFNKKGKKEEQNKMK